jgi:hypothetical protein
MVLTVQGFLTTRRILHEALSLESVAPLSETKYGGYVATIASCYEGYVYEIEADVAPTSGAIDMILSANAFPFADKIDIERFLEALSERGMHIPTTPPAAIACSWDFRTYGGYCFPHLKTSIRRADTLAQSELVDILRRICTRLDDSFPIFMLACRGGIAVPIAIDRLRLALGATVEHAAH